MAKRLQTYDGVEILQDWKSSMPFFPTLKQRHNSIQKIEEHYFQEGQLNIFPSSFMAINDTIKSVRTCLKKSFQEGLAVVAGSLISLMDIEAPSEEPPEEIQCEVLVLVPEEPAIVLCVLEHPSSDKDRLQKHLKHLAQQIMYSVRLFSDEHFSVLHGLASKDDFTSVQSLRGTLREMFEKRSKFCHPEGLSMGKRKLRNIGLAVLASIAVTDIPWQLNTDTASNRRASDEKELWFLTKEQFDVLSETVNVTGQRNSFTLDLKETGGEVEVNIDGSTFMVLELAKRWNKLKPTLACTKVLQHFQGKESKKYVASEITNIAELRVGQANLENIRYVVAEEITGEDVDKLLAGRHQINKCIVFNTTEPDSLRSATNITTNWKAQEGLDKINFLEATDAEINQGSDTFVETSLFQKAFRLLLDRKCLVITGASGDGKTTLARALCRHLRDSKRLQYTPLFIRHLDDFERFAVAKERQIVILEDMFGTIKFSVQKLLQWEKMLPKLEDIIKFSDTLLVVTCKTGFEETAFPVLDRIPYFNRDCLFDISKSMTFEDKMQLVKTYGHSFMDKGDPSWEILVQEDDVGFPLSCRLILKESDELENISRAFRRPIEFMRKEMNKHMSADPLYHAFLVMLVSSDGRVDSSNQLQMERWNLILQRFVCDVQLGQAKDFKDVQKDMPKCYIQTHPLNPNITSFTHQAVFFAALQCIAMENIDLLMEFAAPSVVFDFLVLETPNSNVADKTIVIPKSKEKHLLEICVNLFEKEQNGSVFLNASFSDESFVQNYITELQQKRLMECLLGTFESNASTPLQLIIFSKNMILFTRLMNSINLVKLSGNAYLDLLLTCCKSGNISALNTLLQRCRHLSMNNLTLCLEAAVLWYQGNVVDFILRHRASGSKKGRSELIQLLFKDNKFTILDSVLRAIDYEERVNTLSDMKFWCSQHNDQCTVVTCLTERQDLVRLRHFCSLGANMSACNGRTETPLHIACRNKDESSVEFLITHRVNLEAKTNDGKTPLDYACQYESLPILHTLLLSLIQGLKYSKGPDTLIERRNFTQMTSLHLACLLDQVNVVKFLISSGEDINSKDKFGQTPLLLAIEHGNTGTVDLLLKKEANIMYPDINGRTPLIAASSLGDISTAKRLIRVGSDVNQGDRSGVTPLHLAADLGLDKLVELLLQNDADFDKQTTEGMTPLHIACKRSNYRTVKLLLDKGASDTIRDINGQTPLELARAVGEKSIINTLLRRKALTPVVDQNKSPQSSGQSSSAIWIKREK